MSPRRAGREGSLAFVVETPGPEPQPCSRQWGDLGLSQDAQKLGSLIWELEELSPFLTQLLRGFNGHVGLRVRVPVELQERTAQRRFGGGRPVYPVSSPPSAGLRAKS